MTRQRYFPNDAPLAREDPHPNLVASLTRILEEEPPGYDPAREWDDDGLFRGPSSIAYLFFKLSQTHPALRIKGQSMTTWCRRYLDANASRWTTLPAVTPSRCGVASERLVISALEAALLRTPDAVQQFCRDTTPVLAEGKSSNEWLYGRAGCLYLARMVKTYAGGDESSQRALQTVLNKVVQCILDTPRPWVWHGKEYSGAVHGTIGIILQCVLSCPDRASELESELVDMLDQQLESGNWPSSAQSRDDRLVQFCHGAPGFVLSLLKLRAYYPHLAEDIDAAIERGRRCIWERGLLVKEPCLCHGIAGNALALDSPQLEHFLSFTTPEKVQRGLQCGEYEPSSAPYSLMCGESGRAWAWAVVDQSLERSCIGFSDL